MSKSGPPPYGYEYVPAHVAPNEQEQKTIAKILRMHEQGSTPGQIARWLDADGVPPRRAANWSKQAVIDIIKRESNREK